MDFGKLALALIVLAMIGAGFWQTREASEHDNIVKTQNAKITLLENKVRLLEQLATRDIFDQAALVGADAGGYGLATTRYGTFPIIVQSVTPAQDGFRVIFRIGNMTSADFEGFKLKVDWGIPFDPARQDEYRRLRGSREYAFTAMLPQGKYTNVGVMVAPATPESIKVMSVQLDFDVISLSTTDGK